MQQSPNAWSRFWQWPWSRVLLLISVLLGLLIFNLVPARSDQRSRKASDAPLPPASAAGVPAADDPSAGGPSSAGAAATEPGTTGTNELPSAPNAGEPRDKQANAAAEALPVWQRPPRTTLQPFPDEARFDPPQAPMKIPPEMIGHSSDAAATPPTQ